MYYGICAVDLRGGFRFWRVINGFGATQWLSVTHTIEEEMPKVWSPFTAAFNRNCTEVWRIRHAKNMRVTFDVSDWEHYSTTIKTWHISTRGKQWSDKALTDHTARTYYSADVWRVGSQRGKSKPPLANEVSADEWMWCKLQSGPESNWSHTLAKTKKKPEAKKTPAMTSTGLKGA